MKYYVYQHIYKDANKKRDVQILDVAGLGSMGFHQEEVKERGHSFTISYPFGTLAVSERNTKKESEDMVNLLVLQNKENIIVI
jgi:hypothetical protein